MAACVAPRAVARPRLDRRRVSRSPVVRRTTRASSGEDAESHASGVSESRSTRRVGTPRPLPSNFDLDTAVLLGGFAFESYSTPEGGVVDADVQGGSTAYLSDFVREVYLGVLEVTMVRAEGLPRGDTLGLSDPYCVVSVGGGSSARTNTKRFTLDPKWDDEAPMRLLVKRTRPGDSTFATAANQTLTVRVLDEDGGKSDDLLGVTRLPLRTLIDGSLVKIPLTGKIGLAVEEEVTAALTAEGGGVGGRLADGLGPSFLEACEEPAENQAHEHRQPDPRAAVVDGQEPVEPPEEGAVVPEGPVREGHPAQRFAQDAP